MAKVLRCPRCGGKDCKEKVITLDKIGDTLLGLGEQTVKYLFTGKYDHMETLENISQVNDYKYKTTKRTYRCKRCLYEWKS